MSIFSTDFTNAVAKQDCLAEFGNLEDSSPSTKTVLCTILIIVLTCGIEAVAHASKSEDCCYEKDENGDFIRVAPVPTAQTGTEAANTAAGDAQTSAPATNPSGEVPANERKKKDDHVHIPSPTRRANRLVGATALIIPITIAFAVRMQQLQITYPLKCQLQLDIAPPQWWAIVLFDIIPFICASLAWLRTLVDCILVRWDKTLTMGAWPPAWPLAIVAIIIAAIVFLIRDMVFLIMGRRDLMTVNPKKKNNDIEMDRRDGAAANEEEQGLMEGARDGDSFLEDDEATVYSPKSSMERKATSPV
jgi:hypothetical protein